MERVDLIITKYFTSPAYSIILFKIKQPYSVSHYNALPVDENTQQGRSG